MQRRQVSGPTLFLDFDGVLHADTVYRKPGRGIYLGGGDRLFMHAEALATSLEPFPSVRIVLSTSWVNIIGFDAAMKRLPAELQARVVGATYHRRYTPEWQQQTRYQQIAAHVTRHALGSQWLAIDDDTEGWPVHKRGHLISPQGSVGLQALDLELLVRRLAELSG